MSLGGSWAAFKHRPFRFRVIDVVLFWVLISLAAISFIADYPVPALIVAITRGATIGVLFVMGADRLSRTEMCQDVSGIN